MSIVTGYWEGYPEQNIAPYPLNQVPSTVDIIPIAFISPTVNSDWTYGLAERTYPPEKIEPWIKEVKQKVLFSLQDNAMVQWNQINIDIFCQNIAKAVTDLGLSGIDIDAESNMSDNYVTSFVDLIEGLRKYLSSDKLITYTCYTESDDDVNILHQAGSDIDIVQTMAYWYNFDEVVQLFNFYGNLVGNDKISVGVKVVDTGIDEVQQIAEYLNKNNYHKMMLWSATQDVESLSGSPDNTWSSTIKQYL